MTDAMKDQVAKMLGYVTQQNPGVALSPQAIEAAVEKILAALGGEGSSAAAACGKLGPADYPLAAKRKDLVKSSAGLGLDDITLQKVVSGDVSFEDIRIKPETLGFQAQIAESVGRPRLADNLRRASELTRIPDQKVLDIYNKLRPYRCTKEELLAVADELENLYQAKVCAAFVREAATVYEKNGRLKS